MFTHKPCNHCSNSYYSKGIVSSQHCTQISGSLWHSWGSKTETKYFTFYINYDDDGNIISVTGGASGSLGNSNPYKISAIGYSCN